MTEPKTVAEAIANTGQCYRIMKERLTLFGHASTIPRFNDFSRIFHALVAVCGKNQDYIQNTCNALAVITWIVIKFDRPDPPADDPVKEFVWKTIEILNGMARDARKKERSHVIFGPICKN
jgi:hypothetical protein